MPDILSAYAASQPDKLAVIDDRGDEGITSWTYAELETQANRLANALAELGAGPGQKVIWCGPNSLRIVAVMAAARKIGAVAVPLNYRLTPEEARYIIGHADAPIAYVDAEYAHLIAGPDGPPDSLRHVIVFGGAPPAGAGERAGGRAAGAGRGLRGGGVRRAAGARARGHVDDDLHLGHHRQAQGRAAPAHRRVAGPGPGRPDRLHPGRRLPDHRPAVSQRARARSDHRPDAGPDRRGAAPVRARGLAAAGGQVPGQLDVLGADADPDGVRAARRGQGALRPHLHEADAGQRRAVELRAQGGLPGRLPGRLAVGDLRLHRDGRELRAGARRPAAQAGLVRQARARQRDPAPRRDWARR